MDAPAALLWRLDLGAARRYRGLTYDRTCKHIAPMTDRATLEAAADKALAGGNPKEAVCYLAELVSIAPEDRNARVGLAIALGDAGNPAGALRVLRATADHLAYRGFLLPAMIVVRHGLEHAPEDNSLVSTLKRLHVRGVRAKAGNLLVPPPLKRETETPTATAEELLATDERSRLERATEVGARFNDAGESAAPMPMPLFCELDGEAFVETVKRLHYKRLADGTTLLREGESGDTLLIIASGEVKVDKGGTVLATVSAGSVLGEMALITGAPRSATATATGEVEIFELSRADVQALAESKPQIAEELVEYCRKRLIANLLRSSPLFKRFDDDTRFRLLEKFQRQGFQPGATIIAQGEQGSGLFVLATGEVEVSVNKEDGEPVVVANLSAGEVFGEISLLKDQPTNATVKARGRTGALFLPSEDFRSVLDEHPEVRTYLEGLSDDRLKASEQVQGDDEVIDADELIIL